MHPGDALPEGDPALVWSDTLDDGTYRCQVWRGPGGYTGRLVVWDESKAGRPCLLDEPVPLSYAARFGPDLDDLRSWQSKVLAVCPENQEPA